MTTYDQGLYVQQVQQQSAELRDLARKQLVSNAIKTGLLASAVIGVTLWLISRAK